MRFNKYFPFASVYFFINSVALPLGVTYMALLGPFFYGWVLVKRKNEIVLPFLCIILPFVVAHVFFIGVDLRSYALTLVNIFLIYCFCHAFHTFLKIADDPASVFQKLLIMNAILFCIAIPFYFSDYYEVFWIEQSISSGVKEVRRLKLFTYEASYYAMLFVPLFLFFWLQYLFRQNRIKGYFLLPMLFIPLALSFSIGVIGALLLSGLIVLVIHFRGLMTNRRIVNIIINTSFLSILAFLVLAVFFPGNPFFSRMINIFSGEDGSGQGRTSDAFFLAHKIAQEKNEIWGIGPGQLKIVGQDIIRAYYRFDPRTPVAIPNAVAETYLLFGWIGTMLRIGLQLFLFFHTRVWSNYYRLLLFFFMFIYQFTGSFITNVAEYVIWILAFTQVFPAFDITAIKSPRSTSSSPVSLPDKYSA